MIICIDFDGTCVTHSFPFIGKDIGAVPALKALTENGHKLILFTMRGNLNGFGNTLEHAIKWFEKNEIPLWGIQRNPEQDSWTDSPKAYGQLYIDDAALGCPLIYPLEDDRPYVDWRAVSRILLNKKLITQDQFNRI